MNFKTIALLSTFFGFFAWAQDMPSWVLKQPVSNSSEVFYVGSSEGASSYAEAIESASKMAMEKAIRENFGVDAQLENKFLETNKTSSVTSTLNEKSKRVRIEGFETKDSYITNTKSGWSAFVLFSYQKSEISAEKKRLKSLKSDDANIHFSEIGNSSGQVNGRLEIISDPPGASVLIDGKDALSKTPIRLSGILEVGSHAVTIDHPDYQSVVREIIISPGNVTTVNETLIPAAGYLNISSTLSGSVVLIDGKAIGTTPVNKYKVPANHRIKIDYIHPDAYKTSSEVSVSRDEDRRVFQPQQLLPAQIQITTVPTNANVFIDGRLMPKGWGSIDPGTHTVEVSLKNYRSQTKTIVLRGGEKKLDSVTLMSISEEEKLRLEAEENERDRLETRPWIFTMGLSYNKTTFKTTTSFDGLGLDFMLEKKLMRYVGIKGAIIMMSSDSNSTYENPSTMEATQYELSLPIYLTKNFYAGPAATKINVDVTCLSYQCSNYSISQSGNGWVIGYQLRGTHPNNAQGSFDIYYDYYKYENVGIYKGNSAGRLGFAVSFRY